MQAADTAPAFFEIVEILAGSQRHFPRREPKEKLIVCRGHGQVSGAGETHAGSEGSKLDLAHDSDGFTVTAERDPVTVVRLCGHWGDETGGSGLFAVQESAQPADVDDPVAYPKFTNLDRHFHDCDEYWIIWEGSGVAVSKGRASEVAAGDCIATGMGHHHDFPRVSQSVRAVFFETTLEGAKWRGHLWEHTHGPAAPRLDRV